MAAITSVLNPERVSTRVLSECPEFPGWITAGLVCQRVPAAFNIAIIWRQYSDNIGMAILFCRAQGCLAVLIFCIDIGARVNRE